MRLIFIVALLVLALSAPSMAAEPAARPDIVAYGPTGPFSGWLLTPDRLFRTEDEGQSWRDVTPASAGGQFLAADFLDDGTGWLVAAPAGAGEGPDLALAHTADNGVSWRWTRLARPADRDAGLPIARAQLDLANGWEGRLRLIYASSSNFERWSEWATADGGVTWVRVGGVEAGGSSPTAALPETAFLPGGVHGWRIEQAGECTANGVNRNCKRQTRLSLTHDGGQTWRPAPLPSAHAWSAESTVADAAAAGSAAAVSGSRTMIGVGQGFDKCEAATLDQLREWRRTSPYSSVNLYIGGALRACSNRALDANYVRDAGAVGWTFIPTWVGPQAPCTSFRSRISYDPATAQGQGWAEANAAADTLTALGLTGPDGGSLAYYDMEAYTSGDGACNAAVQAFITGWDQGMRARGHLAGVYGLGWTLSLFANLAQPPDAIWPAHWIEDSYDADASVWNVYRLDNKLWVNHQRLRQYTGGHVETWGAVALNIDSNVLDGPVGVAAAAEPPTPTPTLTPTPTRTPFPFTPRAWVYLPVLVRP